MQPDTNELINVSYKLLSLIYDNQVTLQGETYCPLSQQELSDMMGMTRATINTHLPKLRELGLLEDDVGKSKKYILTDRAIQIVEKLENI